jgi:hypothetical protein
MGRWGTAERFVNWEGRAQNRNLLIGKVGHSREFC